jgi:phosphoribosylamine--glycine ligase
MKVLVVGSGGREHAILWKLAQSPRQPELFAAPGNAGTAEIATNLPVKADDIDGMLQAVGSNGIDLTIVGPEGPLVAGMVDVFQREGLRVFGPTSAASQIEGSKAFAKRIMHDVGVPTAAFRVFDDAARAKEYVHERGAPVVVKADGLAAGKGVVVATDVDEALQAVDNAMVQRVFGDAGARVVIEDCVVGQEVSVFCFTDGTSVTRLVAACDYKRVFDGDKGPNTGGMGGYSPPPWWDDALEKQIRETCIEPIVAQLAKEGTPYRGVLYGGVFLTNDGPVVFEFNARLGDPEAQLILPLLESDLLDAVDASIDGEIASLGLTWSDTAAVAVVLTSGGYPGGYETGKAISGLDRIPEGAIAFHAGSARRTGDDYRSATGSDDIVTAGGRVLALVGHGVTMAEARVKAYEAAGAITFEGAQYRSDIANFAR